jgi:hypothetical protein
VVLYDANFRIFLLRKEVEDQMTKEEKVNEYSRKIEEVYKKRTPKSAEIINDAAKYVPDGDFRISIWFEPMKMAMIISIFPTTGLRWCWETTIPGSLRQFATRLPEVLPWRHRLSELTSGQKFSVTGSLQLKRYAFALRAQKRSCLPYERPEPLPAGIRSSRWRVTTTAVTTLWK